MITIVTGEKDSGKTNRLYNWYLKDPSGCGILTLKQFSGDVHIGYDLLLLPDNESFPLCRIPDFQTETDSPDLFRQGRFIFSQNAFDRAISYILKMKNSGGVIWLDEIGYLELREQGFFTLLSRIISEGADVRMSIRNNIMDEVLSFYGIEYYDLIVLDK